MPAAWETYETTIGQTYDTAGEAEEIIQLLNGKTEWDRN